MATLNRTRQGNQRGQAIVELALTLPLLLLVVLGVFDFGLMFQRFEVVTNAAREGARVAVLPGYTDPQVQTHVRNYLTAGGIPGASATVTVAQTSVDISTSGAPKLVDVKVVTVTYTHQYGFVGPLMGLFGGSLGSIPLRAASSMRKEAS